MELEHITVTLINPTTVRLRPEFGYRIAEKRNLEITYSEVITKRQFANNYCAVWSPEQNILKEVE